MRTIVTSFFLFAAIALAAQNLVVNPGFEEHGKTMNFTKNGFKKMEVKGWYLPTLGSSDYLITGPTRLYEDIFLKTNYGAIDPYRDSSFAGFIASSANGREYIGGQLSAPLVAGKKYTISFALALGSMCDLGVSELGMYFSKEKVYKFKTGKLKVKPQVAFDSTASESFSGKWKIVTAEYTASGGETYFVIGNFTGTVQNIPGAHLRLKAYYLVDEVSVVEHPVPAGTAGVQPGSPSRHPAKMLIAGSPVFETGKVGLRRDRRMQFIFC